jgi:hypothetical protein
MWPKRRLFRRFFPAFPGEINNSSRIACEGNEEIGEDGQGAGIVGFSIMITVAAGPPLEESKSTPDKSACFGAILPIPHTFLRNSGIP